MNKALVIISILIVFSLRSFAQVSINTTGISPDSSAMLDIQSTEKGVLVPRMTTSQRAMISAPATGLLVFDLDFGSFWFYDGSAWQNIAAAGMHNKIIDADEDTGVLVEQNSDDDTIRFEVAGAEFAKMDGKRLQIGYGDNLSIGYGVGVLDANVTQNTIVGSNAGHVMEIGYKNSFFGSKAGYSMNGGGSDNTFIGASAGYSTESGDANTMVGSGAGALRTGGLGNVHLGYYAGYKNDNDDNIFIGMSSGFNNQLGARNIIIGGNAGFATLGSGNVMIGYSSGQNETGSNKLYIANSNTTTPLIYGDFGTNLLRINGTLNLNNSYSLPMSDGTSGQAMITDGAGNLSWSTPGDNLGNHVATTDININNYRINNGTSGTGIKVDNNGTATMRTNNTATIGLILDGGDTPALRFNQDGSQGWTAQTWDISGNETSFFVRDVTHASKLPFRIKTGSDHDRLVIKGANVGIATEDPETTLDVNGQICMRTGAGVGKIPVSDANGIMSWTDPLAVTGDNLGNHILTDTLQLNDQWIMNGISGYGISLNANGTEHILTVGNTPGVTLESNNTPRIRFYQNGTAGWTAQTWDITAHEASWQLNDVTAGTYPLLVYTGSPTNSMVVRSGKVGLGFNNPGDVLHMKAGGIRFTDSEINNTSNVAGVLMFDENFYGTGEIGSGHFNGNGGGLGIKNEDGWGALISTANMQWLNMDLNSLNIGGTTDPGDNNLIVNGVVKIAGGSPGSGKVLTSDASGNATWQNVSADNVKYAKNTSVFNSGNNDDQWRDLSTGVTLSYTAGNSYKIEANQSLRLTAGTGIDEFEIRVKVTASCNGEVVYANVVSYTPPEGSSDHDNFLVVPYLDILDNADVPCGPGNLTFVLQVRNTGDDAWEARDRVLTVTKF